MGWFPTQTVLRANLRLHRGDPMRAKALRREQVWGWEGFLEERTWGGVVHGRKRRQCWAGGPGGERA